MEIPTPLPIVSARDVLPGLGFLPVWGTPTDLEPAYEFKGGGIDIRVAQVSDRYWRPAFIIGGHARNGLSLHQVEQFMPLALESRDQVVAWVAYAVGTDFQPLGHVEWFEEGRQLQALLPWEVRMAELRAEAAEYERLRALRPHCRVARADLRSLLNASTKSVGWPPAPGDFSLSFDGELLKLGTRGRVGAVQAVGHAWSQPYTGQLSGLRALPRRLSADPVVVGVWNGALEIERVRIPLAESTRLQAAADFVDSAR